MYFVLWSLPFQPWEQYITWVLFMTPSIAIIPVSSCQTLHTHYDGDGESLRIRMDSTSGWSYHSNGLSYNSNGLRDHSYAYAHSCRTLQDFGPEFSCVVQDHQLSPGHHHCVWGPAYGHACLCHSPTTTIVVDRPWCLTITKMSHHHGSLFYHHSEPWLLGFVGHASTKPDYAVLVTDRKLTGTTHGW